MSNIEINQILEEIRRNQNAILTQLRINTKDIEDLRARIVNNEQITKEDREKLNELELRQLRLELTLTQINEQYVRIESYLKNTNDKKDNYIMEINKMKEQNAKETNSLMTRTLVIVCLAVCASNVITSGDVLTKILSFIGF